MDEKRNLKKELNKLDIDYNNLTCKEKEMLKLADKWITDKFEQSKATIADIQKYDYSIRDFCNECGINRATLYKKNSQGERNYKVVIQFLNSKSNEYKEVTARMFETFKKESKDIKNKINKLLSRDVEYMELQAKVKELEKRIKSLEKENRELIKKRGMAWHHALFSTYEQFWGFSDYKIEKKWSTFPNEYTQRQKWKKGI